MSAPFSAERCIRHDTRRSAAVPSDGASVVKRSGDERSRARSRTRRPSVTSQGLVRRRRRPDMGFDTATKTDADSVVPEEYGGMWFLKDELDADRLEFTVLELEPGEGKRTRRNGHRPGGGLLRGRGCRRGRTRGRDGLALDRRGDPARSRRTPVRYATGATDARKSSSRARRCERYGAKTAVSGRDEESRERNGYRSRSATFTSCFPTFSPSNRPRNASGAFSKPSTTFSRY